ncbi:MAG: type pilus assembly protein PilO [Blastocatellia bacterium]|jgi:Tfp pilus assembly protein PilO|nr:type pilus assembly protein PilO [Blastocatellia bacterium]
MSIGNINNIPWYLRLGIFTVLALAVYGGFWYFVTSGTRKDTKGLQEQVGLLQKANAEAQIASQRLNEFRTAYKNKQQELEELRALLPEQRELTKVLEGIQDRAHVTGLSLRKFQPKDDVQQDFYSGKRIEVSVQSSFAGLRAFFDQMAHYQRIVSITNFEVKQMDKQAASKTVEARFDLTAYYVSSEKLQKQNANQPANAPAAQTAAPTQAVPQAVTQPVAK